MKPNITIGEKYDPAMKITDTEEAQKYFEECVEHTMSLGKTREKAIKTEKANIGYYAGYYDHETRIRVESLFDCRHPVFGEAKNGAPSVKDAFMAGANAAQKKGKRYE